MFIEWLSVKIDEEKLRITNEREFDEFAPLALELTIITNLTNLQPIKMKIYGKRLRRLVIIVS